MPISPAVASAVIGAGGDFLGQAVGAISQGIQNAKMRQWNEKMYGIQRQHALDDYHMQNAYNSPREQMARLRDAGLNPHLVYGNGADAQGGIVRNTNVESWNPRAPTLDLGSVARSGLSGYFDAKIKEATVDNLTTQNTVLMEDANLKKAQTLGALVNAINTQQNTKRSQFDLRLQETLQSVTIEKAKAELRNIDAQTKSTLDANDRAAAMQGYTIAESIEKVLRSRAERTKNAAEIKMIEQTIKNLQKDEQLKQLDINLKQQGIQPGDPAWMRIITQWFSGSSQTTNLLGIPGGNDLLKHPISAAPKGYISRPWRKSTRGGKLGGTYR